MERFCSADEKQAVLGILMAVFHSGVHAGLAQSRSRDRFRVLSFEEPVFCISVVAKLSDLEEKILPELIYSSFSARLRTKIQQMTQQVSVYKF